MPPMLQMISRKLLHATAAPQMLAQGTVATVNLPPYRAQHSVTMILGTVSVTSKTHDGDEQDEDDSDDELCI